MKTHSIFFGKIFNDTYSKNFIYLSMNKINICILREDKGENFYGA